MTCCRFDSHSRPSSESNQGTCQHLQDQRTCKMFFHAISDQVSVDRILIIDTSGSMKTNDRINIAKDAAKTVIETLSFTDYVGIVSVSLRSS